jgi:HEAT repeat protein
LLVALNAATLHAQQPVITTEILQDAIRSDSADRQQAAVRYLLEGGVKTVKADPIRRDLFDLLRRTNDLRLKGATLRVLEQLPDFPTQFAKLYEPYLKSPQVEVRRGAADGVGFAIKNLVPADIRNFTPVPGSAQVAGAGAYLEMNSSFVDFESACENLLPLVDIALKDSDSEVRYSGAEALRHVATTIATSLPHPASVRDNERIINIDDNRRIWIVLLPTMQRLNDVIPDLRFGLQDPSPATRRGAALAASAVCSAKRLALATRTYQLDNFEGKMPDPVNPFESSIRILLPHLVARLKDPAAEVRLTSMEAIEFLDTDALVEVDGIAEASQDPNVFVRWVAARALGKMVPKPTGNETVMLSENGEKAIQALAGLLGEDEDVDVRKAALTALASNGTRSRGALDAVLRSAGTGVDVEVRLQALRTLEVIKGDSAKVVPVLVSVLGDDDVRLRKEAALGLGHLGKAARSAVPALKEAMRDDNADIRKTAAEAILLITLGQ